MSESNKTIKILAHDISYYYNTDQEMPEHEQEHVRLMINEGWIEGELCDTNENRGHWSIEKEDPETLRKYTELLDKHSKALTEIEQLETKNKEIDTELNNLYRDGEEYTSMADSTIESLKADKEEFRVVLREILQETKQVDIHSKAWDILEKMGEKS